MNLKVGTPEQQAATQRAEDPADKSRIEAAKKFEAVLMHQLLSVMRQSAKSGGMGGSEGASGQYTAMFDEAIADKMAEGGGIGLSRTLIEAMGGSAESARPVLPSRGGPAMGMPSSSGGLVPNQPAVSAPLPGLSGATAKLAQAAYAISAPEGGKQWSRAGTLTERDLSSQLETPTAHGVARFAVKDASGYRDAYKCNLFAFEAARRAGFEVPVINRDHGYGYPLSNVVTEDAQDGTMRGDWATVVPKHQIGELKDRVARGEVGLMLAGSGRDGRHGHMAVVERIHDIQLDEHGDVKRIEFDGYEARADGAQHLTRRSWNRVGNGDDSKLSRNGFGQIELLALRPATKPQAPEIRLSEGVRPSGNKAP
ncbi:MAG: Rod binding protein [Myxococcaceae bacterium]|nr:Rod binding protein [Myxococcaceae bacterium]